MAVQKFEKSFHSSPDVLPEVEEFAFHCCAESKLDKEKHNDLTLSISEAASNSIKHGNKNDPSKKVLITILADDEKLTIKLKDEGKGFDPQKVPDPTAPENILKDSGRGIFIINSFAKNLQFNFTDTGTEVSFEIYR